MARYSKEETLKIEYLKSRIREIRYLEYALSISNDKLEEIENKIRNVYSSKSFYVYSKKISKVETDKKWNKLIQQKEVITKKKTKIEIALKSNNVILDLLSPTIKEIAIDLLVKKISLERIKDKYYVSNPYQALNDELRYLEIDNY